MLAVTGCASLAALQELGSEIQAAGYESVNVNHQTTNGYDLLVIEAARNEAMSSADADKIAEIAWTTYSAEFDELQIVLNGELMLTTGPDELASRFGERPAGLVAEDTSSGPNITALVVILVCAAAFVVLLVLVWRRGRRPPPGPDPPYPPQVPPYPYAPPQP